MQENEEEEQFRAIAMGELSSNREWQHINQDMAELAIRAYSMMKKYGIESLNGVMFVCESDIPVFTVEFTPHARDHMR